MNPNKVNDLKTILNRIKIVFLFLLTPLLGISQFVESISSIKVPQTQALVVDYMGEDAGASILVGFFYLDIDTDKDGITDFFETAPGDDLDGDGLINSLDPDDDNDGILDAADVEPGWSYFNAGILLRKRDSSRSQWRYSW